MGLAIVLENRSPLSWGEHKEVIFHLEKGAKIPLFYFQFCSCTCSFPFQKIAASDCWNSSKTWGDGTKQISNESEKLIVNSVVKTLQTSNGTHRAKTGKHLEPPCLLIHMIDGWRLIIFWLGSDQMFAISLREATGDSAHFGWKVIRLFYPHLGLSIAVPVTSQYFHLGNAGENLDLLEIWTWSR